MRQILKRIVETLVVIFGNCIYAFGIARSEEHTLNSSHSSQSRMPSSA